MNILALDIGGTAVKSGMIDPNGAIRAFRSTPSGGRLPEILVQTACGVAESYGDFDVLAVSMTGLVDCKKQVILARNTEHGAERAEVPVGEMFRKALRRPVFILNDANAAALGEACFGAGRKYRDFLCVTYGTGVGGGIIQKGELLEGCRGIAGEIGHFKLRAGGLRCRCGRRGCYQEYASTTALVREAQKIEPDLKNAKELFARLPENPALRQVIDRWIKAIAEGLCSLSYILDPACIVLGGGVMEQKEVPELVKKEFHRQIIPSYSEIEILPAELGNNAGMIGAAEYARRALKQEGR